MVPDEPIQPLADAPEPIAIPESLALTSAPELTDYEGMSNLDLIAAAKAAKFPQQRSGVALADSVRVNTPGRSQRGAASRSPSSNPSP